MYLKFTMETYYAFISFVHLDYSYTEDVTTKYYFYCYICEISLNTSC